MIGAVTEYANLDLERPWLIETIAFLKLPLLNWRKTETD
jgi:hypothetical protein